MGRPFSFGPSVPCVGARRWAEASGIVYVFGFRGQVRRVGQPARDETSGTSCGSGFRRTSWTSGLPSGSETFGFTYRRATRRTSRTVGLPSGSETNVLSCGSGFCKPTRTSGPTRSAEEPSIWLFCINMGFRDGPFGCLRALALERTGKSTSQLGKHPHAVYDRQQVPSGNGAFFTASRICLTARNAYRVSRETSRRWRS